MRYKLCVFKLGGLGIYLDQLVHLQFTATEVDSLVLYWMIFEYIQ